MLCRFLFLALVSGSAVAQPRFGLEVGAAFPRGELAVDRAAGIAAGVSVGSDRPGLSPRLDLSLFRLESTYGVAPDPFVGRRVGDYTSVGVQLAVVVRGKTRRVIPYGLVGIGAYGVSVEGEGNPYGTLFGAHAGLGLEVSLQGPVAISAVALEVGTVVMATDYGAGAFNFPTVYLPVTVGVRF